MLYNKLFTVLITIYLMSAHLCIADSHLVAGLHQL